MMNSGQLSIAIVIPIYNRIDITRQGLQHIITAISYYKTCSPLPYVIHIVVVDDGSTDGSKEWIESHLPEVTVLAGTGDLWWTGAVNLGITYALSAYPDLKGVILQNDDIVIEQGWLFNFINAINANPGALIGCATSTLNEQDVILYGGRLMKRFARERKINYRMPRKSVDLDYTVRSFDLYGRGLYIPVGVFLQVGLFDTRRFKHRGDMDLPLRAKKAGFDLRVSYGAIVFELPQHGYNLDLKETITFKEAYKLLTDFRSSYSLNHIFHYSVVATENTLEFIPFFLGNCFYHMRNVGWRLFKNYV